MRLVRTMTALAAGATLGLTLAGCGSDSGADGPGGGVQHIDWWGWAASDYENAIAAFEKEHPDIDVTFKPYQYEDYVNALGPALTSGEGPDVFEIQPGPMVSRYAPLAVDQAPLQEETNGDGWADRFRPQAIDQLSHDGQMVASPGWMSAAGLLWYNEDLFKKHGVKVPTSFAELETACETFAAEDIACVAHGAKDGWANEDLFLALAHNIAPGKVYDAIEGDLEWTDPDLVAAMEAYQQMFDSGIIGSGATSVAQYPDASNAFMSGKAAMIVLGTWNDYVATTSEGLKMSEEGLGKPVAGTFRSTMFPGPNGSDATHLFGGPDNGWAISKSSDEQDAAWTFVNWITSQKEGVSFDAKAGLLPALSSVSIDTSDVTTPGQVDDIEAQTKAMSSLIGRRQIPYPDLDAALVQALSAVAGGTQSPSEALADVESVSQDLDRG